MDQSHSICSPQFTCAYKMLLKVMQQDAECVTVHTNINFKLNIRFSFFLILAVTK